MTDPAPAPRGGPRTPEGKARSAMNALRHGLRAARFALLPHEDPEAFRALVAELRARYRPADPIEQELVDAVAVAMWREARADRLEAEAMADIPPADDTRSCGTDLTRHPARASLATVLRYRLTAQAEHRRALALLAEHRRLAGRRAEAPHAADAAPPIAPSSRPDPHAALAADTPAAPGSHPAEPAQAEPAPVEPPAPAIVSLRWEERTKRNPLDTPLGRVLGRDPDLVLPVPGVEPRFWPLAQDRALDGPFPAEGPQPYRRVPGLPWDQWWCHQHLLDEPPGRGEATDGPARSAPSAPAPLAAAPTAQRGGTGATARVA